MSASPFQVVGQRNGAGGGGRNNLKTTQDRINTNNIQYIIWRQQQFTVNAKKQKASLALTARNIGDANWRQ